MEKKKKFDKNIFGLLTNYSLHTILTIYVNTFLVAYILNISSGNFFNVALYYLIAYITLVIGYFLFSFIASKINKTLLMQISSFLFIPILIIIAILDENITNYIIPISIGYNLVSSLYYVSQNAIVNEKIKGKLLQTYNTSLKTISSIVTIIVPIIFGSIIDSKDIQIVSIFVVVICTLLFITTLFIDKSSLTHNSFNLKEYKKECITVNHKKAYKLLFLGQYLYGLKDGLTTLITILIVLTFKNNFSLGAITSIISCISVVLLIATNKMSNKNLNTLCLPITGLVALSIILLLIDVNKPFVIIFNICFTSLLLIVNRSFSVRRSGLIRAIDKKEYILEHQALCELFLDLGRITFYIILIFVSFSHDILIYKLLLAIGLVAICLYGTIGYLSSIEYDKILIEKSFLRNNQTPIGAIDETNLNQNQDKNEILNE